MTDDQIAYGNQWRPLPLEGLEKYEVSDLGFVRGPGRWTGRVMLRRQSSGGQGYFYVRPWNKKAQKHLKLYIHRAVLLAFVGYPLSSEHEAAHNDGNRKNNRLSNLRWATRSSNQADRVRHGTSNRGEQQGRARLTQEQAREARRLYPSVTQAELARRFNVSPMAMNYVVRGLSYRD